MVHQKTQTPETNQLQSEEKESEGMSLAPPAFSLTASTPPPVQRQEAPDAEPTQGDTPEVDPFADLAEEHKNPLTNSNTSEQNLILLVQEWEANDSTNDDRKLGHILATAMLESGRTFQSVNENLSTNYFPSGYAPTGYWGRGFVQLTHEGNYEDMGDELNFDLEDHREAAILPTISAYTTANGMLDGDFTGRSLNRYLPVTENEEGEREEGEADWFNARRVVNGVSSDPEQWSHQAAEEIAETAEAIYGDISAYRAGIADESIESTVTLSDYLYNQTNNFEDYKDTDALRIAEALGHMEFQAPNMSGGTEMQQEYQGEVEAAGHASSMSRINNTTERDAIRAFQVSFNENHHLVTPLPETGEVDARTHEMMMLDGNRIASGRVMIEASFNGAVEAINPYEVAFANHQAGTLSMNGLALEIHSYMPAHVLTDVTNIFDQLGGSALNFAYALARAGHTHDRLAYINPEVLARMHTLLSGSGAETHTAQAQRVAAVMNYAPATPDGQYITHVVQSGEFLSTIARQYGMTYQALGDLNNIPAPYSDISVGQELNVPNPDFDPDAPQPDAPQVATTIEPLVDNGPEPEVEENTTTTPTTEPTTEGSTPAGGETAPAENGDGGGGGGMGGALKKAWQSVKDFISGIFG